MEKKNVHHKLSKDVPTKFYIILMLIVIAVVGAFIFINNAYSIGRAVTNCNVCDYVGLRICDGFNKNAYRVCTIISGCRTWGAPITCPYGQTCTGQGQCAKVPSCTNDCSQDPKNPNKKFCYGSGYRMCGQYDSDTCLDWSSVYPCAAGKTCTGQGQCVKVPSCTNDCSQDPKNPNKKFCYGSGYRMCGQYDSDTCLDWSSVTPCPSNYYCSNGQCVKVPSCTNDCSNPDPNNPTRVCATYSIWQNSIGYKVCGQYDSDACLDWSSVTPCPSNYYCSNGQCIPSDIPPDHL